MTLSDLDRVLQDLLSGRGERQANAHEALLTLAEDAACRDTVAARLEPLVTHANPQVRGSAYVVLAAARGDAAVAVLENGAGDVEPGTRCDVANAAALIGVGARGILLRLLADPVLEVRFAAASGLAELGEAEGFATLIQALDRPGLRFQALSALQSLGDVRARDPVRKLFRRFFLSGYDRTAAAGVLARLGDEAARGWLIERVARRKGEERGLAIEIAGDLRLLGAAEPLAETLCDRDDVFRGAAARALGMMGDERHSELLERTLLDESDDPETRMDAAEGLMHLGTPTARRLLEQAAERVQDPDVREVVREALEALANP